MNSRCQSTSPILTSIAFGVAAFALVFAPSAAFAQESGYYANGKFHKLIQSETEFAVEFEDAGQRQVMGETMRANSSMEIVDVPWDHNPDRFAILKGKRLDHAAQARLRGSRSIKALRNVYRLSEDSEPILSSGKIVVKFKSNVSDAERDVMLADYKVQIVNPVEGIDHAYVVEPIDIDDDADIQTANALYRDGRTVYAHPDFYQANRLHQFGTDTFFSSQWHLSNTGQGGGTVGADISIFDAWNRTFGNLDANPLIGQLDDACDVLHEDLVDNYIGISHNAATNVQTATAANPSIVDDRHGTATMGLMVASFNGIGVRGVAPDARFTASRGIGTVVSNSQVASAYAFARSQGVDVHNNSWGFGGGVPNPDVVTDAIETAFLEGREGLGMIICFASGNGKGMEESAPVGVEVNPATDLAALPTVLGVGASNANDVLASYSNYGREIDVLAPSIDFPNLPGLVTTDNTDGSFVEPGYNNAGQDDDGNANLANPSYTDNFGGTSGASPIVAGIAALILSLEPDYTATQVRNIIEHTCDKINPTEANYNGITSRSLRYGYGRVNAGQAVEMTFDGFFWPERVANVQVDGNAITWKINDDLRTRGGATFGVGTASVLVVQADAPFSWAPTDGISYNIGQSLLDPDTNQPTGATVVANFSAELFNFDDSGGTKYFGIYPATFTPRRGITYGFGVSVNSAGSATAIDSGVLFTQTDGGTDNGGEDVGSDKPNVSINVSPLSGTSPLRVTFRGNAQSTFEIASFVWDFDDGTTVNSRNAERTYIVANGTQRFFPRLIVTDVMGNVGERSVAIDVSAPSTGDGGGSTTSGTVRIRIADPDSPDTSNISAGEAPLSVILNAEVSGFGSTSLENLQVFWDLGDGNTGTSQTVFHTYQIPGTFPVTVTVTDTLNGGSTQDTAFITVTPNPDDSNVSPTPTSTPSGGNGTTLCGTGGVMAMIAMLMMFAMRRLRLL
ncbi:MAG TPA: S8 family serine peptidase [Phycisphaerae bacterium]|nr:S8 family serine peptidase [Phycisphaerae bacterium]